MNAIEMMLLAIAAYLAIGVVFGVAFALVGAGKIDDVARHAPIGFRVLILPGAAALWPMLLKKWRDSGRAHAAGSDGGREEIAP
jgi:hypothetical protein